MTTRYLMPSPHVFQAPPGNTNLDNVLLSAINQGATHIILDGGTTYTAANITRDLSGLTIDGQGARVNVALGTGMTQAGSLGSALTLSVNAAAGDLSITLSAVTGLVAGDWILISSDATRFTNGQQMGELRRIEDITGSVVTLHGYLDLAYTTANNAQVQEVTWRDNIHLKNIDFVGASPTGAQTGFDFRFCQRCTFENVRSWNFGSAGFQLITCEQITVKECDGSHNRGAGLGYGVSILSACNNVTVKSSHFIRNRHSLTTGYSVASRGMPSNISFINNTVEGSTEQGIDTHSETQHNIIIKGNHVRGCLNGIRFSALSGVIADNDLMNCGVQGTSGYGIFLNGQATALVQNVSITGNTLMNTDVISTSGWGIYAVYTHDVNVTGNNIHRYLNGCSFDNNDDQASVVGNRFSSCAIGPRFQSMTYVDCSGNHITEATSDGILVATLTHGKISNNFLYLCRTGIIMTRATQNNSGVSIMGNHIMRCTQDGIRVTNADNVMVAGNYVMNADDNDTSTYDGITLEGCDNAFVSGNSCLSSAAGQKQVAGIRLDADCDGCFLDGNTCWQGNPGGIEDAGTNTVYGFNVTP